MHISCYVFWWSLCRTKMLTIHYVITAGSYNQCCPPVEPGSTPFPYFTQSTIISIFYLHSLLLTLYISGSDAVDMTEIYQWVGGTDIDQYCWLEEIANIKETNRSQIYWPPLLLTWFLTLIPAWISNHIHYKEWDEITYPFLNFNGVTVEVWEWISNSIPHFTGQVITYPCWD